MRQAACNMQEFVHRLRSATPLTARARPSLADHLRRSVPQAARAPLTVSDIYDGGAELGLLCLLDLRKHGDGAPCLVVPLGDLAFDRRHPLAHEIALLQKRRTRNGVVASP
jgi:hypothetical protein